uniref:Extensin-like n=1 Tax=Knipowitschia caucasica TaxID=637954 RepID=A0AAV2LK08_KNICA
MSDSAPACVLVTSCQLTSRDLPTHPVTQPVWSHSPVHTPPPSVDITLLSPPLACLDPPVYTPAPPYTYSSHTDRHMAHRPRRPSPRYLILSPLSRYTTPALPLRFRHQTASSPTSHTPHPPSLHPSSSRSPAHEYTPHNTPLLFSLTSPTTQPLIHSYPPSPTPRHPSLQDSISHRYANPARPFAHLHTTTPLTYPPPLHPEPSPRGAVSSHYVKSHTHMARIYPLLHHTRPSPPSLTVPHPPI